MSRNILVLSGHPDEKSFCHALAEAYASADPSITLLDLGSLAFDPVLHKGYRERQTLEPDLLRAQEMIRKADHLVIVHPVWWGAMPALLKGLFDRVLLPGFAWERKEGSPIPVPLLKGKTAELMVTMGGPSWYYHLAGGGHRVLTRCILGYCGIKTVRITECPGVRNATAEKRAKWLKTATRLGYSSVHR